jgi:hypothetical protein
MGALLARVHELVKGGKRPHLTVRLGWIKNNRICRAVVNGVTVYQTVEGEQTKAAGQAPGAPRGTA